jgi:hypothetical protein
MGELDPLIEGYLGYLAEVSRKSPRTVIDVRCTLRRAVVGLGRLRPGISLWRLELGDYLRWIDDEREAGRTPSCLAKYLSHVRGLLDYAWRSGRAERNVLDGFQLRDAKTKRRSGSSLARREARAPSAAHG